MPKTASPPSPLRPEIAPLEKAVRPPARVVLDALHPVIRESAAAIVRARLWLDLRWEVRMDVLGTIVLIDPDGGVWHVTRYTTYTTADTEPDQCPVDGQHRHALVVADLDRAIGGVEARWAERRKAAAL